MASPELKVRIKDKELYSYYNGNPELHKDALKWYKAHKKGFTEYIINGEITKKSCVGVRDLKGDMVIRRDD